MEGVSLSDLETATTALIDSVSANGVDEAEAARGRRQLRARLVFETDSVTNIAHQLGYFETVAGPGFLSGLRARIDAVTVEQIADVARRLLTRSTRTVGWFQPLERRP
jgi:predicted Zn-dependent peptidase